MKPGVNPALTGADTGAAGPRFRLSTLGDLRLEEWNGAELLPGRRKELALLAYLARHAPRAVGREELAALLWGERESAKARQSLRHALLQLRRALGDAIEVTPGHARVDSEALQVDAVGFERDVNAGRLSDAVARWRGDFLPGAEDAGGESFRAWAEAEREGLRRRLALAFERLVTDALGHGQWAEAVARAAQWAEVRPLDEQPHRRLIEALKAAGRPDEALARHATFTTRLREELGRDPSPAFKALASGLALTARQVRTSGPGSAALLTPDMVGREAVFAELVAAWHEARAGSWAPLLVTGSQGLGKTRLCQELMRWVRSDDPGACVLMGRAHEGERGVPWAAARQLLTGLADAPGLLGASAPALRALAQIVPAVGAQSPPATDAVVATEYLGTAAVCEVLEAVAAEVPVLLVLDDAPFADTGTQQVLAALLERSLPGMMLVLTGQPDALAASALADELRHNRVVRRLQLQPLSVEETDALVGSMVALAPDDRRRLAVRLHAEGGGNPFYVTELVFALADDGTLALGADGHWRVDPALVELRLPLPSGPREAIRQRLATLSADERLCVAAAAVERRRFDSTFLQRATGLAPDRLGLALNGLLARRLLREVSSENPPPTTRYEFAHEMVRRVAHDLVPALPSAQVVDVPHPRARRVARRRLTAGVAVLVLAAMTAAVFTTRRAGLATARPDRRPTIAIMGISVAAADTTAEWLVEGLPQMIAAKLSHSPEVEIVPPAQTRAVRLRAGLPDRGTLSTAQALDLAARLRATIAVSGELTRAADTAFVLSLAAHEVATGRLLRSAALTRADVLTLADEAAARLLATADATGPGLRLADLETSSVAAYQHYVRASRLSLEGHATAALRELDAAVALDSGFVSAVQSRWFAALSANDSAVVRRLEQTLERFGSRATEYDRLQWAAFWAFRRGEVERSEALARDLVRRRPRDPRARLLLIDIYGYHGRWDAAEAAIRDALALDSLGMAAGRGPCAPCLGYERLVGLRLARGDWSGAEHAARRWIALQPELPAAWLQLATTLAYVRSYDEALAAMRRAVAASGDDPVMLDQLARMLVLARRLEEADSLVTAWRTSAPPALRRTALDLRVMLDRERGELRAANRSVARAIAADSGLAFLELVRGNTLARLGDYQAAERLYEVAAHGPGLEPPKSFPAHWRGARGFCWHHALLADALAPTRDTLRLLAIADTLERGCVHSYFARDWTLHHHVRGLVRAAAGRYADAVQEFRRAPHVVAGAWSRTRVEQAKSELALGRPHDAIASLTLAYATPLDAMGRYVPRSELDYHMALAFRAAGMLDSAARYAAHVRRAWKDSDPEVKRLLGSLP